MEALETRVSSINEMLDRLAGYNEHLIGLVQLQTDAEMAMRRECELRDRQYSAVTKRLKVLDKGAPIWLKRRPMVPSHSPKSWMHLVGA